MLELKDVDFVRDDKLLLSGVSLTVGEGERWALLGPNGAGKRTRGRWTAQAAASHWTRRAF